MSQIARLTAEDRDDLVAYLDGELEGAASERIGKALASSPVARNEVEMLTRTWDLLDLLPAADPDREFTERTLAAARSLDESVPLSDRAAVHVARGAGLLALWAAGLAGAATVGYLAAAEWAPGASDALVRDEPVLRDLPRLRDAQSETFLQELNRSGVLIDLPPDLDPEAPASPE
ncbi:anti-sigma factor [Alienimonas californiensis]|uniref:Zinc-finger domain-containing protein n=1 Tax=Alienimonas californiensis TaxID=2527989 RepID=A0A517PDK9_9PLAN|nr:hypothetical protein [Alienimonas californiensis]QDT17467.1 hypothetical protein CA12_35920 [Alienimonas californiensis]